MNDVSEHELVDDPRDPMACALREEAPAARLTPSSRLRTRTLAALHNSSSASRSAMHRHRSLMTVLAAAAMIGLATLVYLYVRPAPSPDHADRVASGPHARSAQPVVSLPDESSARTLVSAATVRLASFTRPLEREANALRSDLKRVADRLRNALPLHERRFVPSAHQ